MRTFEGAVLGLGEESLRTRTLPRILYIVPHRGPLICLLQGSDFPCVLTEPTGARALETVAGVYSQHFSSHRNFVPTRWHSDRARGQILISGA